MRWLSSCWTSLSPVWPSAGSWEQASPTFEHSTRFAMLSVTCAPTKQWLALTGGVLLVQKQCCFVHELHLIPETVKTPTYKRELSKPTLLQKEILVDLQCNSPQQHIYFRLYMNGLSVRDVPHCGLPKCFTRYKCNCLYD